MLTPPDGHGKALGALLGGPANLLVPVGQSMRGRSPIQQRNPTPLVFDDLHEHRAVYLAARTT
jgi:hypothetical protein